MQDFIFVRCNARYVKVFFSEIIFIRSKGSYVQLVTERKVYLVLNRMGRLHKFLPAADFCRVHRSYIVALRKVAAFDNNWVWLDGPSPGRLLAPGLPSTKELPLGSAYRAAMQKAVPLLPNFHGPSSRRLKRAASALADQEEMMMG